MRVDFSVVGDTQYSRAFQTMAGEADDLSEPLAKVGVSLIGSVHEQFRTEGSHGLGAKWKPLSPAYAMWKRQQVGEQPIMVFSGKLRSAMISPDSVAITPRRLVYEPKDPGYGIRHQLGTADDRPPQRKLVALPLTVRRDWDRYFVSWLNDLRKGPAMWGGLT